MRGGIGGNTARSRGRWGRLGFGGSGAPRGAYLRLPVTGCTPRRVGWQAAACSRRLLPSQGVGGPTPKFWVEAQQWTCPPISAGQNPPPRMGQVGRVLAKKAQIPGPNLGVQAQTWGSGPNLGVEVGGRETQTTAIAEPEHSDNGMRARTHARIWFVRGTLRFHNIFENSAIADIALFSKHV